MELLVERIANRPIDSSCYILYTAVSEKCIVVDPGTSDCMELLSFLERLNLTPEFIILTHEHFDHIAGVNKIKDIFGAQIICSANCSARIVNSKKNMSLFYDQKGFTTYPADILTEDINFKMDWDGNEILFFETKGHSEACISFSIGNRLFTGDCLIKGEKTVTKLPGGSKEKLLKSLEYYQKNFNPDTTIIYPGHGAEVSMNDVDFNELI
jgi:glyoxylase-like metal-dependent hydrolase (beta-lactamase superfamily II)